MQRFAKMLQRAGNGAFNAHVAAYIARCIRMRAQALCNHHQGRAPVKPLHFVYLRFGSQRNIRLLRIFQPEQQSSELERAIDQTVAACTDMAKTRTGVLIVFERKLLLDEIARIRAEGVDREIFTLCKNEKYGQLIENLENVEDSASQMADFALSGQTVAQQIATLAALTAEDADAALQTILQPGRMAAMYIDPDGTADLPDTDDEAELED